jgi:hypothetical protein
MSEQSRDLVTSNKVAQCRRKYLQAAAGFWLMITSQTLAATGVIVHRDSLEKAIDTMPNTWSVKVTFLFLALELVVLAGVSIGRLNSLKKRRKFRLHDVRDRYYSQKKVRPISDEELLKVLTSESSNMNFESLA